MDRLSTSQAIEVSGTTLGRLNYWAKNDVVVPSTGLPGVGGERGYELDDIAILRFVRFLGTNSRLNNLRHAAKMFRQWLSRNSKPSANTVLLVRDDGTLVKFRSNALAKKLNGDSFATIIHPHSLRDDLVGHSMEFTVVPPKRRGRPPKTTHQAKDGRRERER